MQSIILENNWPHSESFSIVIIYDLFQVTGDMDEVMVNFQVGTNLIQVGTDLIQLVWIQFDWNRVRLDSSRVRLDSSMVRLDILFLK